MPKYYSNEPESGLNVEETNEDFHAKFSKIDVAPWDEPYLELVASIH